MPTFYKIGNATTFYKIGNATTFYKIGDANSLINGHEKGGCVTQYTKTGGSVLPPQCLRPWKYISLKNPLLKFKCHNNFFSGQESTLNFAAFLTLLFLPSAGCFGLEVTVAVDSSSLP